MSLRDINLKRAYSSDTDDTLRDFYIPALANSIEYRRLAGFFSSTSLAVAARGLVGLIRNNGTMKLLASPRLQQRDVDAILTSTEHPEKYLEQIMLPELNAFEQKFVRDHVFALGWMIANNRLHIKVAIVYDQLGVPLTHQGVHDSGLFHPKVGLLTDGSGNTVSFSGSVNESASAWLDNIEEFKVFRSWHPAETDYVQTDVSKFARFWHGVHTRLEVMDIPRAVKERLIKMAPPDIEVLDLPATYDDLIRSPSIDLYPHQEDAVTSWLQNAKRGIFEMATGTGKTYTALGCLHRLSLTTDRLLVAVTCPYGHLLEQWKRQIDEFGIRYDNIIRADGTNRRWRADLADSVIDLALGYDDTLLVLTTHRTCSSADFTTLVSSESRISTFLIADEVHGLGADKSQDALTESYDFRLGLSATPKRWFDSPGTRAIYDFFGDVVYTFTLKQAINTINPVTGQTYLTPYRYSPQFVSLSPVELDQYNKYTKAIGARFGQAQDEQQKDEILEMLLFKRANIIKNAQAKYDVLDNLLEQISPIQWTIIYCSPQQIDLVMDIVNNRGILAHRFTMNEGTTPIPRYAGRSERDFLLDRFAQGDYQVLVAMRCLDEGVDVPPARRAILLSSAGNPRQYIQRIGRVIRRYPGKTEASIHDIVVVPALGSVSSQTADLEYAILQRELDRYEDIARPAINAAEALKLIYDVRSKALEER